MKEKKDTILHLSERRKPAYRETILRVYFFFLDQMFSWNLIQMNFMHFQIEMEDFCFVSFVKKWCFSRIKTSTRSHFFQINLEINIFQFHFCDVYVCTERYECVLEMSKPSCLHDFLKVPRPATIKT